MTTIVLNDDLPVAWKNLIKALSLLSRGTFEEFPPLICGAGKLTVLSSPAKFTEYELAQLRTWGFSVDEGLFYSYRYGASR